jgi:hypothetical protein
MFIITDMQHVLSCCSPQAFKLPENYAAYHDPQWLNHVLLFIIVHYELYIRDFLYGYAYLNNEGRENHLVGHPVQAISWQQ